MGRLSTIHLSLIFEILFSKYLLDFSLNYLTAKSQQYATPVIFQLLNFDLGDEGWPAVRLRRGRYSKKPAAKSNKDFQVRG